MSALRSRKNAWKRPPALRSSMKTAKSALFARHQCASIFVVCAAAILQGCQLGSKRFTGDAPATLSRSGFHSEVPGDLDYVEGVNLKMRARRVGDRWKVQVRNESAREETLLCDPENRAMNAIFFPPSTWCLPLRPRVRGHRIGIPMHIGTQRIKVRPWQTVTLWVDPRSYFSSWGDWPTMGDCGSIDSFRSPVKMSALTCPEQSSVVHFALAVELNSVQPGWYFILLLPIPDGEPRKRAR